MRGFQPAARERRFQNGGLVREEDRGGNMGKDAVLAAIRAQSGATPAPQTQPSQQPSWRTAIGQMANALSPAIAGRKQQIDKESGYADGGRVRPRGFVAGPGTGTSDSIKARLSDGEYVLPADTVQAVGVDALDALKDATHTPVAKPDKNRMGEPLFANAGLVDDERKRNSFGDAAAAANDHGVQQVMGQATQMTAAPEVRAAIGQQVDAPARIQAAVNQIPTGISGQRAPVPVASTVSPPVATAPAVETDHQAGAPSAAPVRVQRQRDVRGAEFAEQQRAAAANRASWSADYDRAGAQMAADAREAAARRIGNAIMRPASSPATPIHPVGFVPGDADMPARDVGKVDFAQSSVAAAPGQQPGVANAAPVAPASGATINTTDRSGDANMPAQDVGARGFGPAVVPAAPTAPKVAPGIYRQGNSFGDSPEAAAWGASGSKNPNANDLAAADAIANRSAQQVSALAAQQPTAAGFQPVQAPQVLHSGNSWQARNDLRNAEVSASSIANNGGRWDQHGRGVVSPERAKYAALLSADAKARGLEPELAGKAMQENAGLQREGMQQAGATNRTGIQEQGSNARAAVSSALQRDEFGLKKEAAGFQTRAAQRLENLQTRYEAEKDPAKRSELAQQLRELQAKDAPARYKVAAGGQQIDANGVAYRTPDRIFNEQTGVFSDGAGAAPAPQAMPKPASKAEFDALPKGTRFTDPNGQVRIK